jgi:hypothetical protein
MTAVTDKTTPTRTLTITSTRVIKSGVTRGKDWCLRRVFALDPAGVEVPLELVTFFDLPEGTAEFEVERRQRGSRGQYVSYALKPVRTAKAPVDDGIPRVPDGRYAVEIDGVWKLYRVWRGTQKPDVQRLFAVVGVEKGERVRGAEELAAATAIAVDPGAAAIEFGHRTGCCSRCGEELKVNLSRKVGVGPKCMKHWFGDEQRYALNASARAALRAAGLDPAELHDNLAAAA